MTPQELLGSALSLAVQGKLVEQLEVEGTSDDLYKYLIETKSGLIKKGIAKKSKTLSQITEDEKLFDIPDSWRWIKIGEISSLITKGTTPRGGNVSYLDAGVGFLRAENVAGLDRLDKSNLKYIDENTHFGFLKRSVLEANDILITIAGTLGRTAIVREVDLPLNANQAVSMIRLADPDALNLTYLVYALNSPEIQDYLTKQKKVTAIPNLTLEIIENCLLPLPPLAEQKRIVAKIEELLPLIDRYEQAWSKLEDFNKRFPVDMQKSILQMAIQGKLVEQRPEEGTGEDLFRIVQKKKEQLVKNGAIKKDKPLPEITDEEIPFEIPTSWKWVRIQDLFNVRSAMRIHQTDWKTSGIPFFRGRELVQLVKTGTVNFEIYISRELYEANKAKGGVPQKDDLLISAVGTLGKVYVVQGTHEFYYKDAYILCLENIGNVYPKYIKYVLESPYNQTEIHRDSMATTVAQLTIIKTKKLLVPLPPLAEQKRIVAKLEEILPLCEQI